MIAGAGPRPQDIVHCRSCGAAIVFVRTKTGNRMPVNVLPVSKSLRGPNHGELIFIYGEHESHFATCDDPARFRGK